MLASPVLGSRTWMWTIAAPALAASIAEKAICSGVTGTAGFFPALSADPVTAHEIITLRDTAALPEALLQQPTMLGRSRIRHPCAYTSAFLATHFALR